MVTLCVTKIVPTCSPMVGQCFDTMIVASSDKECVTTHQNISAGRKNSLKFPRFILRAKFRKVQNLHIMAVFAA